MRQTYKQDIYLLLFINLMHEIGKILADISFHAYKMFPYVIT